MDIKDIFNKIEKIEDIKKYMSDIEDGETSYLEFKGVHHNLLDKSKKKESAKFRLTIAKEICAFANTDGGILIIGVDNQKDGGGLKLENVCENIESWADNNLTDLLEPRLHGFLVKPIEADSENKPIAIYIPQSKIAPHRVRNNYPKGLKGEKENPIDIPAEYFVRRGTKSEKLEENLVRAMYLSAGRLPRFEIKPDVELFYGKDEYEHSRIEVKSVVNPDPTKFIKDYYYDMRVILLDDKFEEIPIKNSDNTYFNSSSPIYPSTEEYVIDSGYRIETGIPVKFENDILYGGAKGDISYDKFLGIRLVVINVRYACEGMSLVDGNFYFIVKDNTYEDHLKFPLTTSFRPSILYEYLFIDERMPFMEDKEMINSGWKNEVTKVATKYNLNRIK